jgi:hypothetical protein
MSYEKDICSITKNVNDLFFGEDETIIVGDINEPIIKNVSISGKEYVDGNIYKKYDIVSYNEKVYIAKADNHLALPTDTSAWFEVVDDSGTFPAIGFFIVKWSRRGCDGSDDAYITKNSGICLSITERTDLGKYFYDIELDSNIFNKDTDIILTQNSSNYNSYYNESGPEIIEINDNIVTFKHIDKMTNECGSNNTTYNHNSFLIIRTV